MVLLFHLLSQIANVFLEFLHDGVLAFFDLVNLLLLFTHLLEIGLQLHADLLLCFQIRSLFAGKCARTSFRPTDMLDSSKENEADQGVDYSAHYCTTDFSAKRELAHS